jgi:outer membrane protein TolC
VTQRLKTGGSFVVRTSVVRTTSNDIYTLLTPSYDTAVGVEFRQPLLRGRSVDDARLQLRVAGTERGRAEASLRRQVTETVAAVERAYWSLVAAREEVGVREESLALAEQQLADTVIRIDNGAAPATEAAQPKAEIERRRGELLAARENVSRLESALKVLILSDADAEAWTRGVVPADPAQVAPMELDVAAAMEQALASRPELDEAAAAAERRKAEAAFAANAVKPALDAFVSYDRYGIAGTATDPTLNPRVQGDLGTSYSVLGDGDLDDARVGLALTVTLGNRAAKAASLSAQSAERRARAELASARNSVRAEVLDAVAAVRPAFQRHEAARSERESADVQLRAEKERFAVGLSTNFLVLTRQNDLARARLAEISSRTDYQIAGTELARVTGFLLKRRGIEWQDALGTE